MCLRAVLSQTFAREPCATTRAILFTSRECRDHRALSDRSNTEFYNSHPGLEKLTHVRKTESDHQTTATEEGQSLWRPRRRGPTWRSYDVPLLGLAAGSDEGNVECDLQPADSVIDQG
jgi:hypothetical protein